MVESLYCEDTGSPSIDPVVLFKMVLLHLHGLPSLKKLTRQKDEVYDRVPKAFPEAATMVADSACKTPRDLPEVPHADLPRRLCTHSKDCVKTVQRHIRKDQEEFADDVRYTTD